MPQRMIDICDHRERLFLQLYAVIDLRCLAYRRSADCKIEPPRIELGEQRSARVFDDFDRQVGLPRDERGNGICKQWHGAHDDAGCYPPALAAHDADDLVTKMREIGLDQTRIADDAVADVIGLETSVGANEERRAEALFDFLQGLARSWLR